jgi:hypothetical protein
MEAGRIVNQSLATIGGRSNFVVLLYRVAIETQTA